MNTKLALSLICTIFLSDLLAAAEDTNSSTNLNRPRSVRQVMGADFFDHQKFQLRTGYISLNEEGAESQDGYALGGHLHLYSKVWNGVKLGAEGLTVLDLGFEQDRVDKNPDFFDAENRSFILLSQAYMQGNWGKTEVKLGRQLLDTPHADTDDIRMMPNYFLAYTATNSDIDGLTLFGGFIDQMAGWENGVDSAKFVDIYETLGSDESTNGLVFLSAAYEPIEDLSLALWYYGYNEIANIWYAEASYEFDLNKDIGLTASLQYDKASDIGGSYLGVIDSNTYGVSIEAELKNIGLTLAGAYNKDDGDTGAMGLSLGGGPFFTSMEDQTLDAIGAPGSAWMVGAGYGLDTLSKGLSFGIAYAAFEAEDASLYESTETDILLEYELSENLMITAALASIKFENETGTDFQQFRVIASYNF